jgi:hypothetical protein
MAFASKIFMSHHYFSIKFNHDDIHYDGIVTPSEKVRDDGTPKSFHVVLTNVLFGNVHHNNGKWAVDEQRPQELTDIVGKNIEKNINL